MCRQSREVRSRVREIPRIRGLRVRWAPGVRIRWVRNPQGPRARARPIRESLEQNVRKILYHELDSMQEHSLRIGKDR